MTLFISGRRVKVQRKPLAILACLLEDQGRAIPYKRLHAVTGYVSAGTYCANTYRHSGKFYARTTPAVPSASFKASVTPFAKSPR
jgi:hypothetical protein